MAINDERGTTALQGYDPRGGPGVLDAAMGTQPKGEHRVEMPSAILESMLAEHLTDEAIERILAMRRASAGMPS